MAQVTHITTGLVHTSPSPSSRGSQTNTDEKIVLAPSPPPQSISPTHCELTIIDSVRWLKYGPID